MGFKNVYEDAVRAAEYAQLEFANTYYLAYRDLPAIFREHVKGTRALDFGCGTGRSTRFLRELGFEAVGVDIAPEMVAKAKELDPEGVYQLAEDDDFSGLEGGYDLVLSAFTFDNIPGFETKVRVFRDLAGLLKPTGKIVSVVSAPEIYVNEWASFSTNDFPENRQARSGDEVKIITTEFADRRPTVDVMWSDEAYRDVYDRAGVCVTAMYKPVATGEEPYMWVNETKIAPWVIYVLGKITE
jgi:SAM-dependent methyltransferase